MHFSINKVLGTVLYTKVNYNVISRLRLNRKQMQFYIFINTIHLSKRTDQMSATL